MHPVTCIYCGQRFDRDREPTTKINERRYAHQECANRNNFQKTKEEKDLEELEQYIKKLFNESYINAKIRKQIKDYKEQYNYSYSGILKTLIYWYDVKKSPKELANHGLGIVPYIYSDALEYYYSLYLIQESNANKNIQDYKPKPKIVKIPSPERRIKPHKLFNLGEIDEQIR